MSPATDNNGADQRYKGGLRLDLIRVGRLGQSRTSPFYTLGTTPGTSFKNGTWVDGCTNNTNQTYCSGCTRCNAIQNTSSTAIGVAEGKMMENVRMRTSNDDLFIESTGSQNVVCYVTNPFDVSAHVGKKIEVNVVYQGTTQDGFSTTNVNFHYKYSNGDWKQLLNQNSNFLRIVDTAILVISNVAVDDLGGIVDFRLTPNPVDESLVVEYESKTSLSALCSIRNLEGQLIQSHEQFLNSGSGKLTIPVASLPPGFYLFQIADARGRISTQKFIKS